MRFLVTAVVLLLGRAVHAEARLEAHRPLAPGTCVELIPALTDVSRCWQQRTGLGKATVIYVERACGEHCDESVWIIDTVHGPRQLPDGIGWDGTTVVPSLTYAVADDHSRLVRVDLTRSRLARGRAFARCMAPVLSPGGRWIVCRNWHGDVLRAPIAGGKLERVVRSTLEISGQYPQPSVEFTSDTEMEVSTNLTGDAGQGETVPWAE